MADLTPRETVARAIRREAASYRAVTDPALGKPESLSADDSDMPESMADAALTDLADHPGLVEVLGGHLHGFDSDCGVDFGCSCGAIEDYDEAYIDHSAHLADVIRAWLRGAS